jgi:uncharacterized protein YeaO (DUF488 family)
MIRIRRIYGPPAADDGRRVLVDRLWPRGLSREHAHIDEWLKEIAPSDGLRKWFGHDPVRWVEFRHRYREELKGHGGILERLRTEGKKGTVTLLFAAKDEEHNNAVALKELLDQ